MPPINVTFYCFCREQLVGANCHWGSEADLSMALSKNIVGVYSVPSTDWRMGMLYDVSSHETHAMPLFIEGEDFASVIHKGTLMKIKSTKFT